MAQDLSLAASHAGVLDRHRSPQTRAGRYAARHNDPDWTRFWERGEAHYFGVVRPPASFDLQLDVEDLRNGADA